MQKNEARCDAKNGNFTSEPCDEADDAKYSFRKEATNKKYTFFHVDFANFRGAYRHNWRAYEAHVS